MIQGIENVFVSVFFRNAIILLGVIIAVISVKSASVTARKKQTADMIFSSRKDDTLRAGNVIIRAIGADKKATLRSTDRPNAKMPKQSHTFLIIGNTLASE